MYLDARTQTVLLRVPDPFMVRDLLSKSRTVDHAQFNVAVKHTMEAVKVLGNIGITVPEPIRNQYSWPKIRGIHAPFDHQLEMAAFLTRHRRAFNLSEMGTGKTAASLWAADFLMRIGSVRKVLILSPLSTINRVWRQDIFDTLMHRIAVTVHGSREKRHKMLDVSDADFYIMNHDGIKIKEIHERLRRTPEIDLIIVDEASVFRNASTDAYKALSKLIRPDQRLWLMTGTPCPTAPTDAWALARLVDADKVPKYFGSFKRETMYELSKFRWAARTDAYKRAYEVMQPAIRFKKSDCLDLPPVVNVERQADLTTEQKRNYSQMKNQMQMKSSTTTITAVHAADAVNKLRQILCGVVKDPATDRYVEIDHSYRTQTLIDTIQEASAKVLVIVPFKGIIRTLEKEISKRWSCAVLNGDVIPTKRDQIIVDFKTQKNPHVLLCHPKVMAHGLNLTEADMLIFYAPIYSNDEFQQVIERFNRTGQTRKMTVVRIGAHPIEWKIYNTIDKRQLTQDNILQLYEQALSVEH